MIFKLKMGSYRKIEVIFKKVKELAYVDRILMTLGISPNINPYGFTRDVTLKRDVTESVQQ
jgi:hypothetical protein